MLSHPKKLKSTDFQIISRGLYETSHGIYNHNLANNDHFAHVRFHWEEDTITSSRLRDRLEAYLDYKVNTHLGLSFTEFIDQPSYVCDLQLEILSKRSVTQNAEVDALLDDIKGQGKK